MQEHSSETHPPEVEENLYLIQRKARERYEKYISDLLKKSPKILVVGHSGTGKSSCVNVLFGLKIGDENAANVSHSEPCTQNFHIFGPTKNSPVRIIDSKGIEVLGAREQFDEIKIYIDEQKEGSEEDHVHLAYYFAPTSRWEEADTELVKQLKERVGVIIVINKCDIRSQDEIEAFHDIIKDNLGKEVPVVECGNPSNRTWWKPNTCPLGHPETVPTSATTWICRHEIDVEEENWDGTKQYCIEHGDNGPFGYKELVRVSLEKLPILVQTSFKNAQKVDLDQQHKLAAGIILVAVASAAATAVSPLPFSDLGPLFAIEAGMAAALMHNYGMPVTQLNMGEFLRLNAAVIGVGGLLAKGVSYFLKTTVGYAVGTTIDATVASIAVFAIGVAISIVLTKHVKDGTIRNEHNVLVFSEVTDVLKNMNVKELYTSVMQSSGDKETTLSELISSTADNES